VAVLHRGLDVDGLSWLYLKIENEDPYASIRGGCGMGISRYGDIDVAS